jgi:hypothetical protein
MAAASLVLYKLLILRRNLIRLNNRHEEL